jgi:hypothetical protein
MEESNMIIEYVLLLIAIAYIVFYVLYHRKI